MYDPKTGAYEYSIKEQFLNERNYRLENTYYIKFNSSKGLFAMDKLKKDFDGDLEKECAYYHIYLDLLFEAVGMIVNRFRIDPKNTGNRSNQIKNNLVEYDFNPEKYPLLNDKSFRNFIEHVDEKDEELIDNGVYYGTFNLIYKGMDAKLKGILTNPQKQQNNLLNLENMTYTILDVNRYTKKIDKKVIDLNELKQEIEGINQTSNTIWNYINDRW